MWLYCIPQRLGDLNLRIQRLDISLNILEAKVRECQHNANVLVF